MRFHVFRVGDAVAFRDPKHGFREEGHIIVVMRDQVRVQPRRRRGRGPEQPVLLGNHEVESLEPVRPQLYRGAL